MSISLTLKFLTGEEIIKCYPTIATFRQILRAELAFNDVDGDPNFYVLHNGQHMLLDVPLEEYKLVEKAIITIIPKLKTKTKTANNTGITIRLDNAKLSTITKQIKIKLINSINGYVKICNPADKHPVTIVYNNINVNIVLNGEEFIYYNLFKEEQLPQAISKPDANVIEPIAKLDIKQEPECPMEYQRDRERFYAILQKIRRSKQKL